MLFHTRIMKTQRNISLVLIAIGMLLICIACQCQELKPEFFRALHIVETGGRLGAIKGDNGKALGPFQIHYAYWKASGVKGSYSQCADYGYSVSVVGAWMKRYAKGANWETMARRHNGGPIGEKKAATKNYWQKVKKHLPKN